MRPDGTDIFASSRPQLDRQIGDKPVEFAYPVGAAQLETAVYQPIAEGMAAIEEAADTVAAAANNGVRLIVLPELFCFEGSLVVDVETAVRGTLLKRSLVQKSVIEY